MEALIKEYDHGYVMLREAIEGLTNEVPSRKYGLTTRIVFS
ncbi:hypothetical protein [Bacillus gaemokensis]|nr:hypothetical protein [Bacillus gaemokensis]